MAIVHRSLKNLFNRTSTASFYVGLSKKILVKEEWCGFSKLRNSKKDEEGNRSYTRRILCENDDLRSVITPARFEEHGFTKAVVLTTKNMLNAMKLEGWLQKHSINTLGLKVPHVLHCISGGGRTDKWVKGEDYVVFITYNLTGIAPFIINPNPTLPPLK
jgi:hypothetical protein